MTEVDSFTKSILAAETLSQRKSRPRRGAQTSRVTRTGACKKCIQDAFQWTEEESPSQRGHRPPALVFAA